MTNKKTSTNSKEFEFYKNYANFVLPKLKEYEIERKKILWTAIGLTIVAMIISCTISAIIFGFQVKNLYYLTMSFIPATPITLGLSFLIWHNRIKTFNTKIKQQCTAELLESFDSLYWFPKAEKISDEDISKSELFGSYEGRDNDDTFYGTYKGLSFTVSETNMSNLLKGVKNIMAWPVFVGVIIMINSNKTIKNKTIITTKNDFNIKNSNPLLLVCTLILISYFFISGLPIGIAVSLSLLTLLAYILGVIFENKKAKESLNSIILEDPEFNKKYNVYSSDQIESRYLVTTAFMERFKTLHTAFGSNKAKCAFFDDKVMFAISTNKNLFEIGDLFHPLTDMKHINDFMEGISAIYEIIDYFKLAEKTGL